MRWAVAAGYAVLITIVSSIPSDKIPVPMPFNLDKAAHAVEYGILAFLVCRAVRRPTSRALIIITLCCAAYGVLDEVHQSFVPGRFPSVWDAAADSVGSALSVIFWHVRCKWKTKNRPV